LGKISPVKIYPNFYSDRYKIRKDHKEKKFSGIYLFLNNANYLKMYVGQSKNILGRMNNYLNHSYLKERKNKQPFPKALLKHGTDNFTLIIIEYVPINLLDVREIFWIALLQPYYNILKGGKQTDKEYFHTEETKTRLRARAKGKVLSPRTKALISVSTSGSRNPFFGLTHTKETLSRMSLANSAGNVIISNEFKEWLFSVSSVKLLARWLDSTSFTISKVIKDSSLFRGGWYFSRYPFTAGASPKFITNLRRNWWSKSNRNYQKNKR